MKWTAMTTANFVAEEVGYSISKGWTDGGDWGQCHNATVAAFQGNSFADKFESIIYRTKEMGYDYIELWSAHLDPSVANLKMIDQARKILEKNEVDIIAYYGVGFDRADFTEEDLRKNFDIAKELGAPMIAQTIIQQNAPTIKKLAEEYSIKVGWENHPEKSAAEVMNNVNPYLPTIGAVIDTGWFATYNCDAAEVIRQAKDVVYHVHLKDILAVGAHDSCTVGEGVVDIPAVLKALREIDYQGFITVEHEPHNYDPSNDLKASLENISAIMADLT